MRMGGVLFAVNPKFTCEDFFENWRRVIRKAKNTPSVFGNNEIDQLLVYMPVTSPNYYHYFVNIFVYFYPMKKEIEILKGIHPGLYLERKIREQHLKKGHLALAVNEYPQTLTTITKGKRDMNTTLALKLEKALGLEEGTLMILQVYYDIEQIKKKQYSETPDLKKLRPVIFWDTNINSIDWTRQYRAVIRRVFERGNEQEKKEISRFYGKEKVAEVLNKK